MELVHKGSYRGRTILVYENKLPAIGPYFTGYIEMCKPEDSMLLDTDEIDEEDYTEDYDIINSNLELFTRFRGKPGPIREATFYGSSSAIEGENIDWLGFDTVGDSRYSLTEQMIELLQGTIDIIEEFIGAPKGNNDATAVTKVVSKIDRVMLAAVSYSGVFMDMRQQIIQSLITGNPIFTKEHVEDRDGKSYVLNCFAGDIDVKGSMSVEFGLGEDGTDSMYNFKFRIFPTTEHTDVKFVELEAEFFVHRVHDKYKATLTSTMTSVVPKTKRIQIVMTKDRK